MNGKIGFDYGLFDTETFDNEAETEDFDALLEGTEATVATRFVYDGTPYDGYIIGTPQMSRNKNGIVGNADVELANTDGTWNFLLQTHPTLTGLGKICTVGLYFPDVDAFLHLYTGSLESVSFTGETVVLHLQDKMVEMLGRKIGSGQAFVDYYTTGPPFYELNQWYRPDVIVWEILTNYAFMSDEQSVGNPDIDWTKWQEWSVDVNDLPNDIDYKLQARFAGQEVGTALERIMDMTNSLFWVNAEGKLSFTMFDPPYVDGEDFFDKTNSDVIDFEVNKDNVVNQIRVYHGLDVDANEWGGSLLLTAWDSFRRWPSEYIDEDKMVWHYNEASATTFATNYLAYHKYPRLKLRLRTPMVGFKRDIGERILVKHNLPPTGGDGFVSFWIDSVPVIDLETLTIEFAAKAAS